MVGIRKAAFVIVLVLVTAIFATAQVSSSPPLPAPTGLTATAVSWGQINLGWTASSGATSYNVLRSTTSGGPNTRAASGVTSTSYSDMGLAPSTAYYYMVQGANSKGTSGNSNQASAITASVAAYYVSPNGSDSNSGTSPSSPFQTLGKAQSAMQGSSIKTTYLMAGTYNMSSTFTLSSSDDRETWAAYPSDPPQSAILDGGSTSDSNGVAVVFAIFGGSNITIDGLVVQHFNDSGIDVCGGTHHCFGPAADGNVVKNNVVHDFFNRYGGGIHVLGTATNTKIFNNVVYNSISRGINATADSPQVGSVGDSISGTDIENNVVLNTCSRNSDEGVIYLQDDYYPPASTNITVKNNFIRDYGSASRFTKGIYLEDGLSNATVTQNIVAGAGQWAVQLHGGVNVTITGNLFDIGGLGDQRVLFYQCSIGDFSSTCPAAGTPGGLTTMPGNSFTSNIMVNTGSSAAKAFATDLVSVDQLPTIQHNVYYNYSGGAPNDTGDMTDSNPIYKDPQCPGWTYTIASGGPVFSSPVNFPGIPGGWGPPGYKIPQTGTGPSCPH